MVNRRTSHLCSFSNTRSDNIFKVSYFVFKSLKWLFVSLNLLFSELFNLICGSSINREHLSLSRKKLKTLTFGNPSKVNIFHELGKIAFMSWASSLCCFSAFSMLCILFLFCICIQLNCSLVSPCYHFFRQNFTELFALSLPISAIFWLIILSFMLRNVADCLSRVSMIATLIIAA